MEVLDFRDHMPRNYKDKTSLPVAHNSRKERQIEFIKSLNTLK
jgi:hypothetical protein